MADKEDKCSAVTAELDKELAQPPSSDDFVVPLVILTITYGVAFSVSAVILNALPPQLWTPSPIMTRVNLILSAILSRATSDSGAGLVFLRLTTQQSHRYRAASLASNGSTYSHILCTGAHLHGFESPRSLAAKTTEEKPGQRNLKGLDSCVMHHPLCGRRCFDRPIVLGGGFDHHTPDHEFSCPPMVLYLVSKEGSEGRVKEDLSTIKWTR